MMTYRQILTCAGFILCATVYLTGCDNSKKEQPADSGPKTQQSPPTAVSTEPKRAPRTLKAFQEALTTKQVGAIHGRTLFEGEPPPPKEMPVTLSKHVCGSEPKTSENLLISENKGIQNVVVSLMKIPKGLPIEPPDPPLALDQQKCVFIPHVLLVPVDVEFSVLNSDPVLHNFHAVGAQNKEVNINQTKTKRRTLPVKFSNPDVIRVVCDVHSWMKAWIVVSEHPYYALTDSEGQFRLEDVPEGTYQIKTWHEELGEQIKEVTVAVNQDAVVDFEFNLP